MLTVDSALAATATLVALACTASALDRWEAGRRRADGLWALSMLLVTAAGATFWAAAALGWHGPAARAVLVATTLLPIPLLAVAQTAVVRPGAAAGTPVTRRSRLLLGNALVATGVVVLAATGLVGAPAEGVATRAMALTLGTALAFTGHLITAGPRAATPAPPVPPPPPLPPHAG